MPIGKTQGYDSVRNEHFKYANEKRHVLMSLLFSSMLIHGFLPDAMSFFYCLHSLLLAHNSDIHCQMVL